MTKINICTFKSYQYRRHGTHQGMPPHLSHTHPADLEHVRIKEILGYCDIHKYVLLGERVRSHQGKWKLNDIMEPMLPQSLFMSYSERISFGVCDRRNPWSQSLS